MHDVSFALHAGESLAVVGPNAAGKSTLLRALVGALEPLSGTALVDGRDVRRIPAADRGRLLALVPQSSRETLEFTVREMVAFGRAPHAGPWGRLGPSDLAEVDAALARADATALADRPFSELSGGERQRVLFARALAQQARVLLLDEPTAHLDLAHQLLVVDTLHAHARAGGVALAVLHDVALAARLSRVLVVDAGRLVADGPPAAVLTPERLRETWNLDATLEFDSGIPALRLRGRAAQVPFTRTAKPQ